MPRKKPVARRPITGRQREFYDKLVAEVTRTRAPATSVSMAEAMGYASTTASLKMFQILEVAGWIHQRDVVKQRRREGVWPIDVPMYSAQKKDAVDA